MRSPPGLRNELAKTRGMKSGMGNPHFLSTEARQARHKKAKVFCARCYAYTRYALVLAQLFPPNQMMFCILLPAKAPGFCQCVHQLSACVLLS